MHARRPGGLGWTGSSVPVMVGPREMFEIIGFDVLLGSSMLAVLAAIVAVSMALERRGERDVP